MAWRAGQRRGTLHRTNAAQPSPAYRSPLSNAAVYILTSKECFNKIPADNSILTQPSKRIARAYCVSGYSTACLNLSARRDISSRIVSAKAALSDRSPSPSLRFRCIPSLPSTFNPFSGASLVYVMARLLCLHPFSITSELGYPAWLKLPLCCSNDKCL